MKKRILGILLSVCMILSIIPAQVVAVGFAEASTTEYENVVPTEAAENKALSLRVGEDTVTDENGTVVTTANETVGWRYDQTTNTLTLNNCNISYIKQNYRCIKFTGGDLIIKLEGSSTLQTILPTGDYGPAIYFGDSSHTDSNLYIVGTGTLTVNGKISTDYGKLISISGGAMINAGGISGNSGVSISILESTVCINTTIKRGISAGAELTIKKSAITITGCDMGMYTDGALTIVDSDCSITETSDGIFCNTSATKMDFTSSKLYLNCKYGIISYVPDINITNCFVSIDAVEYGIGVLNWSGDLNVVESQLLMTSQNGIDSTLNYFYITDSLYLDNGTTTLEGDAVLKADAALPAETVLTIPEGASLTVPEGMTFTAQGIVENNGSIVVNGTIVLPTTMSKDEVLALDITGTGVIKYGNAHISKAGACITHGSESDFCDACGELIIANAFPDEVFRNYVMTNFDTDEDGILSADEIDAVETISVYDMGISDLSGVEYFTKATTLSCEYNNLTSLDVSALTELTFLQCSYNKLKSLDVSALTELTFLQCGYNKLKSLDVSNNLSLRYLDCFDNSLTSIDVSNNKELSYFEHIPQEVHVTISDDARFDMTTIDPMFDISKARFLEPFAGVIPKTVIEDNNFVAMDNTIEYYYPTGLVNDESDELYVRVYIDNPHNHIYGEDYKCICGGVSISAFPDLSFQKYLADTFYGGAIYGGLNPIELSIVKTIDTTGYDIRDFTGINNFYNLEEIRIEGHNITSLDLSGLKKLERVYLSNNTELTSLNLQGCSALTELHLQGCTKLNNDSIDLSECMELTYLDVSNTELSTLDVSANSKLATLLVHGSGLTSLDLSKNPDLTWLSGTAIRNIKHCSLNGINMNQFGDISKMSVVGGIIDENGLLQLNSTEISENGYTLIYYDYDTGNSNCLLNVEIIVSVHNAFEHTNKFISNHDGTHNISCSSCLEILQENVPCSQSDANNDVICDSCGGRTYTGKGTENDPYLVTTYIQLRNIASLRSTSKINIRLENDIYNYGEFQPLVILNCPVTIDLNKNVLLMLDGVTVCNDLAITNGEVNAPHFSVYDYAELYFYDIDTNARFECFDYSTARVNASGLYCEDVPLVSHDFSTIYVDNIYIHNSVNGIYNRFDSSELYLDGIKYTESMADTHWPHSGNEVVTTNNDGTHKIVFSCCNTVKEQNAPCTYDTLGYCIACGYMQPAQLVDGVYEIGNVANLKWFSNLVNNGIKDANAKLTADIDMLGITDYVPIGIISEFNHSVAVLPDKGYLGTFDGQGYMIKNLTLDENSDYITSGVFGTVSGTVKNLGVLNYNYDKKNTNLDGRFGAIAGLVAPGGVIEDCFVVNSTVNGDKKVAGVIAGANYAGTIRNCFTYNCKIKAYEDALEEQYRYGWIVGDNCNDGTGKDTLIGTVTNCYTDGIRVSSTQGGTENGCLALVNSKRFASGEIAYLLQNGRTDSLWGQVIDADQYVESVPRLQARTVYQVKYNNCNGTLNHIEYSNTDKGPITSEHIFDKGICSMCGQKMIIDITQSDTIYNLFATSEYYVDDAVSYQWYACNTDDRSSSTVIRGATFSSVQPLNLLMQRGQHTKFKYIYCVAYVEVNGVKVPSESPLLTNALYFVNETDTSYIDYENSIIYTDSLNNINIYDSIISLDSELNDSYEWLPSYSNGDAVKCYGTGSKLVLGNRTNNKTEFTVIVYGDVNGDGVVDVLDTSKCVAVSNGIDNIEGNYALACDIDSNGIIDVYDYQLAVNKSLM